MNNKFEVRTGQTWHKKDGETDVYVKILDMFVSTSLSDFTLFYRVDHTRGGTTTHDELMIDLHCHLKNGWTLVER